MAAPSASMSSPRLGRAEDWLDTGKLDQLLQSGAKKKLSAVRDGDGLVVDSRRIGPPLIFERLWRETGCAAVIEGLLADAGSSSRSQRAIFASVLHRLCIFGSDRACDKWLVGLPGSTASICAACTGRSPGWVSCRPGGTHPGAAADQGPGGGAAVRATRRDLFNDLDLVFFDTSGLYFHGAGGRTLGRRSKSKDHRPELKQMVAWSS